MSRQMIEFFYCMGLSCILVGSCFVLLDTDICCCSYTKPQKWEARIGISGRGICFLYSGRRAFALQMAGAAVPVGHQRYSASLFPAEEIYQGETT